MVFSGFIDKLRAVVQEQEASKKSAAQNFFRNFKLNMGKGRA